MSRMISCVWALTLMTGLLGCGGVSEIPPVKEGAGPPVDEKVKAEQMEMMKKKQMEGQPKPAGN
jgi:hypothetical protein